MLSTEVSYKIIVNFMGLNSAILIFYVYLCATSNIIIKIVEYILWKRK